MTEEAVMVPQGSTFDAARTLVTYLDELVAAGSFTADWVAAVATSARGGDLVPLVFERSGELALALEPLPRGPVAAVAISARGDAVRLDRTTEVRVGVRVTVAVTCCTTAGIIRHDNGRVEHADRTDGVLADLLRSWARPDPCPCCSTDSSPWVA
jgi:hypothetical protein